MHSDNTVLDKGGKKIVCILPAFNEEGKIGKATRGFLTVKEIDEVVVVNDGSTDGSRSEVEGTGATIIDMERPPGTGTKVRTGAAYRTGIDYAIKKGFDIIVTASGNNKDHPDETHRLLRPIIYENYDYVQGSRYLPGGNPGKLPLHRVICTRLYPHLIRIMLGYPATEGTNGFRAFKTPLFSDKRINLWQDWLDGVELEYYLYVQVLRLGYRMAEVPVSKTYQTVRTKDYRAYTKAKPWQLFNNLKPIFYLTLGIKR